jgi:hypothetical protein
MAERPTGHDPPLYWPAAIFGGAASALFLEMFAEFKWGGVIGLLLIECIVFLVAAMASMTFAPQRPFQAVAVSLIGVFLGVLLNVLFHPRTALGFERNLFPIEAAMHTFIAAPVMFVAALIKYYFSAGPANRSSNGPVP